MQEERPQSLPLTCIPATRNAESEQVHRMGWRSLKTISYRELKDTQIDSKGLGQPGSGVPGLRKGQSFKIQESTLPCQFPNCWKKKAEVFSGTHSRLLFLPLLLLKMLGLFFIFFWNFLMMCLSMDFFLHTFAGNSVGTSIYFWLS